MSFKRLDPQDFLISADSVVTGLWTGGNATLDEFYTASAQDGSDYYYDVYQTQSGEPDAEIQFAVSFGNQAGSGSVRFNSNLGGYSPSSVVFGQLQNIVLGDEDADFKFGGVTPAGGAVSQSVFGLSFERARYKGSLFPGSINLHLSQSTGGGNLIELTDNSKDISVDVFNEAGRVYQLVSGSDGKAKDSSITNQAAAGMTESGSYGLVLPDIGMIILNGAALNLPFDKGGLNLSIGIASSTDNENPIKLIDTIIDGANFEVQSQETITSDFVFVRARNAEFNYSENPSFISGSTGEVTYDEFINSPQTFITSIGLYNDNSELLAVAKLSKPLKKDFTKETLVRVKLDF